MNEAGKIRIATHVEVTWLGEGGNAPDAVPAVCPNCGTAGPVQPYLGIDYQPPDAQYHFTLQICPVCDVRFVDNLVIMDYASEELIEIGWHVYQTQLGCGVWPIAAPLTRLRKPAGTNVLEIGGAYGFGLDFCIRARGWTGVGYDPSPLAAFGARELGLSITQDYFEAKDLGTGPYGVIIATEVIEHLPQPPEFLSLMRRAIADDGILVLSTPDAAWITPELAPSLLMGLLSPGAHVVLQTAASLRTALLAAGFGHVTVLRSTTTLVAYASPAPFTLNDDGSAGRAMYRNYLVERSKLTTAASDLRLGFAGRGLFEATNDGDFAAAETAWQALLPAVQGRFGLDLDTLEILPPGAAGADLASLARLIPLGLGMIMFGRVMQLMGQGTPRTELAGRLALAASAITALHDALAQRSLSDGLSDSIFGVIEGEAALNLAFAGEPACVAALQDFTQRTGTPALAWRGLIALVNAAAYETAAALQDALGLDWPEDVQAGPLAALPGPIRLDALVALLLLAVTLDRATEDFSGRLQILQALMPDDARHRALTAAIFVRLVNGAHFAAATTLRPLIDLHLQKLRSPYDAAERDMLFAASILALQDTRPSPRAAAGFAWLRDDMLKHMAPGTPPPALFWPSLRGEMVALKRLGRGDEAGVLLQEFAASIPGLPDDLAAALPADSTRAAADRR